MEKLISEFKQKMYLEGKSKRTIEVYGNSVREFFKWFSDSYGDVEFKKLYRENILEYKSYLKNVKKSAHSGNNLCPKSINSKLSALICFNELIEPDNIVVSKKDLIKIQSEMVSPTSITKKEVEEFRQIVLQSEGCAARRNFAIVTILAYAGLAPTTYQSGQMISTHSHMEKRGSKYLRYALFNATKYVCHWEPEFAAYLAKKRAEGKHYNVAISHAAKKLVRVMYKLEMSGEVYYSRMERNKGV